MSGTRIIFGCALAAASSACCTAQPVASSTWTIRRWLCPPSRVRCQSLPSRLNGTPSLANRSIATGAFSTTNSTVARLLSPAPATIVSSIWFAKLSPGSSTAAIPPCAQAVAPSEIDPFANTTTLREVANCNAAVKPAAPDPMIRTSASIYAVLVKRRKTSSKSASLVVTSIMPSPRPWITDRTSPAFIRSLL